MSSNYAEFFEAHPLVHLLDEMLMGLDQGGISLSCFKQCVNDRLLYKNGGNDTVAIEENANRGLNYKDKVNVAYDDVYEMVKQDLYLKTRYPIGSRFTRTNEVVRMLYKNMRVGATNILLKVEDLSADKQKISLSFIRFSPLVGRDVLFCYEWDDEGLILQIVSGTECLIRMHSVEDEPENFAEQYIVMSELLITAAEEGYEYKQIEVKGTPHLRVSAGESVVEVYGFCAHNIELEVRGSDKVAGVFLSLDNVSEFSNLLFAVKSFFRKCPHALFERHWRKLNTLATLARYTGGIIDILPGIVPCVRITCCIGYTRVFVVDGSHRILKIRHDGDYPWSKMVAVNSPDEAKQLMDALRVNPVNLDEFITENNLNGDMKLFMDDQISDHVWDKVVVFDNNVGEGGLTGALMSFGNNGEVPIGIAASDVKAETEGRYAAVEASDPQPVPPPEKKTVMSEEEIQKALLSIGYPKEDLDRLTDVWKTQQKMDISDDNMLKLFVDKYNMISKGWIPYSEGKPDPEGEEREDKMHNLETTLLNTIKSMSVLYDHGQVSELCEAAIDEAFPEKETSDEEEEDDDIPGGPDLYAETEDEEEQDAEQDAEQDDEQDTEQEKDEYRPESEFEEIINTYGHEFEGQPIGKVRFSHEPWGTNYHSTAEWVDTPCPLHLKVECWWNFDWGGDFHACEWKATVNFGERVFVSQKDTFDKILQDYNETFNALMK